MLPMLRFFPGFNVGNPTDPLKSSSPDVPCASAVNENAPIARLIGPARKNKRPERFALPRKSSRLRRRESPGELSEMFWSITVLPVASAFRSRATGPACKEACPSISAVKSWWLILSRLRFKLAELFPERPKLGSFRSPVTSSLPPAKALFTVKERLEENRSLMFTFTFTFRSPESLRWLNCSGPRV